jgi:phage shock protein C
MAERLYRSRTDRLLAGIAGGMGAATGIDPTLVRIGWVILAFITQGAALIVYIVLVFVIPEAPLAGSDSAGMTLAGAGGAADDGPSGARASSSPRPPVGAPDAAARTPGPLPLLLGVALVLLGAWYLVRPYLPTIDFRAMWPLLAVVLGVVLIVASLVRRR